MRWRIAAELINAQTAANESWNPTSNRSEGFIASVTRAAVKNRFFKLGTRLSGMARSQSPAITVALTIDALGPTIIRYVRRSEIVIGVMRLGVNRNLFRTDVARNARMKQLKPDAASKCRVPVREKLSTVARGR